MKFVTILYNSAILFYLFIPDMMQLTYMMMKLDPMWYKIRQTVIVCRVLCSSVRITPTLYHSLRIVMRF